jgi:hypothetical protein
MLLMLPLHSPLQQPCMQQPCNSSSSGCPAVQAMLLLSAWEARVQEAA